MMGLGKCISGFIWRHLGYQFAKFQGGSYYDDSFRMGLQPPTRKISVFIRKKAPFELIVKKYEYDPPEPLVVFFHTCFFLG